MDILSNLAEKIQSLRRKRTGFITNAFFNADQLKSMVGEEGTAVFDSDDTIVILSDEPGLVRLYFYAASLDGLKEIPEMLPSQINKTVVADIIGKGQQVETIAAKLCESGFIKHNELFRMVRKPEEIHQEVSPDVAFATSDRCDEIYKMIYDTFDIYSEHLPTKEKILRSIDNKEITVVLHQDQVVGFNYTQRAGERLMYNYLIAVAKEFRGKGIGDKLEIFPLIMYGKDHVFNHWVVKDNQVAIKKHVKFNFKPDGMIDIVLIYKGV